MPKDDNVSPAPVETIPLVRDVFAQNAVVAANISQVTLNINGTSIDLQECLRIVGQRGGVATDNDPFAAELDANAGLIERHLYSEALDGLRTIQQKCGSTQGLSKARFRIANNTGVCLFNLERFSEARAEFNEALSIYPDDESARLNLAAVHLHTNEPLLALTQLEKPITNVSVRGISGALRVAALSQLGRHEDIERFLNEESWTAYDAHVQLAVAHVMITRGDAERVDEALRVASDNEKTALNAHVLKGMRALGIAAKPRNNVDFIPVGEKLSRGQLETALAEFKCALDLCPSDLRDTRAEILTHYGMVLALLGHSEQALKSFEDSRVVGSRTNPSAVLNHASLLMERKEFSTAARLIRESGLVEQHPHIRLRLGASLQASGADADAIDILVNAWRTFPILEDRIRGAAMVLASCRRLQRTELAQEISDMLTGDYADSWEAWFHLGQHFAISGNQAQALLAFQKALSHANEEDQHQVREELGYRQAVWGDYKGCIATLNPLDITTLGDGAAQALVVSLYNTGALNRVRIITDTLLTREHVPAQVIEVAVAVAARAGDLDRATDFQRRLLQERGPRLRDINILVDLLLQNGKSQQAVEALATDASALEGGDDAHELMTFAHLLSVVQDKRSLTYGYRSWERGRDQAQIQQGFIGLFLNRERTDSDGLKSDVVAPGTTVTLSIVGRGGSREVSIVRDGDLIPDAATWVRAADPLATRLLGKRVGDEVAGTSTPMGQTIYRIKEIRSNLVRAFQETMSDFNDRFPDATGLWKFELPRDNPSEIIWEFTKVLFATQRDSSRIKELMSMHTQGRLPLAALAVILQCSVPETWSALVHDDSGRVCFSFDANRELAIAERIIGEHSEPVYLDYSSLMTLILLGDELRAKVAQIFKPARIVQSLLDDLHIHAIRAIPKGADEGMAVSISEDGRLRSVPLGDRYGFITRLQEIARAVASPCATYAQFDAPSAELEMTLKLFGKPTSDLLWEAAATGGIIICDDHALGTIARKTQVVSIQAIALAAYKRGRLTISDYSAIVERLAIARYRFVTMDEDVIKAILERHQWKPTSAVLAVFSCLEGPACTTLSAAHVGAGVLKSIVLEPTALLSRDALVDILLARLTKGHDLRQIMILMSRRLSQLLWLAPIHLDWLHRVLNAWLAVRS